MSGDTKKDDMDAILSAMSNTLDVSNSNEAPQEHPRYSQYKNYGVEKQRQQKRRSDWLERQKDGRDAKFDKRRSKNSTNEPDNAEDMEMAEASSNRQRNLSDASSSVTHKPGSWKHAMRQEKRYRSDLRGRLMYSEWLIDVPEDFAKNWVMVPAPKAKRVMITLNKHDCRLYNKAGQELNFFKLSVNISHPVIFDGFVCDDLIFILDFIDCGPYNLESCNFDCRYMIGKSFVKEQRLLASTHGDRRKWSFALLEPTEDCAKETIESFMAQPTPYELDGLMFYCKDGFYSSGVTPLVGWLKPWMLPDILEAKVHKDYLLEAEGTTPKQFMEDFSKHSTYAKIVTKEDLAEQNMMEEQ